MEKKIILYDSPEAAQQKRMMVWVDRHGYIFTDERAARYSGCTHKKCECGNIREKSYIYCEECWDKIREKQYNDMPFKEWDGETPLCIFGTDIYFFDEDEIIDYCEDNECDASSLKLCICEPNHAFSIDVGDMYCDLLPEDGDVPKKIEKAADAFNKAIKDCEPLCWSQGKERTLYKTNSTKS